MNLKYQKAYKIEKGITIPKKKLNPITEQLYDEMEVGDSVVVDSVRKVNAIGSYFYHHGRKICQRKIDENQYRVWRIK